MQTTRKTLPAALAGCFVSVTVANAAIHPIPTPTPSVHVDANSSLELPQPTWADEGSRIKLAMLMRTTATNAVLLAFGRDENGNAVLEPEETERTVGVECGNKVDRDEFKGVETITPIAADLLATTNAVLTTFEFKQPQPKARRWTHVKVITCGKCDHEAQVTVKIWSPGIVVFVR